MSLTPRPLSFRIAVPVALAASLVCAGLGQSRPKNESAKVQEAAVLKDAYILMAMGDHDYDGHRVKAMRQVEDAIKRIDHKVMKDGTNGQKVVAAEEEIKAARAAYVAKHSAKVHEAQALSDMQLREARELLTKVHESLGGSKKHPKGREHVANALKELDEALKTR